MKKLTSICIALLLMVVCVGLIYVDADAATSGYYTYTVKNGKATITDVDETISGNITIPSKLGGYPVVAIGDYAFDYCFELEGVTIQEGVTTIGKDAFFRCDKMQEVTIPSSVTSIGDGAFDQCYGLTGFRVAKNNPNYSTDSDGALFNKDKTTLVAVPGQLSGSYTIPDSVTAIRAYIFNGCAGLTSVTIGDGIITVGEGAFQACVNLKSVTFGDSVTTIEMGAFLGCGSLTELVLPDSITTIGRMAFLGCDGLTKVTLPKSVTKIEWRAFDSCMNLQNVYYQGSKTQKANIDINENDQYLKHLTDATWYYNSCIGQAKHTYSSTADGSCNKCGYVRFTPVAISKQPVSVQVVNGGTAKVTVNATGDGLTYKWYFKNKGESKFALTTTFKGNTYTAQMNAARSGRQLYCVITDKYGNTVKTNTVTIGMKVSVSKQPVSVQVVNGGTAKVTMNATGDGLTYKWYFKNKGESKFTLTTSFTGNTYKVAMNAARSGRQVKCVVTDKYGNTVTTKTVTIGMKVSVSKQPVSVTVAKGATAKVTLTATGDGLTYKWYFKNKGESKFTLTTTFKGNTYTAQMNAARSGRQMYCVITDKYGNVVKTNTVTIKMR